ncbi:MAG TPA: hypothetical protein VHG92_10285 [Afifellaceae bacterium]|nr:hypothetical protein [Afifellaceae bacterium]
MKGIIAIAGALALTASVAQAQDVTPPEGYQAVSGLVELPDFLPGMGALYVQPETLPAGPFLAYDRRGELVSSIYMIPLAGLEGQESFEALGVGAETVVSTDLHYNAGHPGVEEPHYHIVLWHVPPAEAELE